MGYFKVILASVFLIATSSYSYPTDKGFGNPLTDWDNKVDQKAIKNGGYAYEIVVTDPATGQKVTRVYNSKTPWSDEDSAKLSKSLACANNAYTLSLAGEPKQPPEEPEDTTPLTPEEQRQYDFLVKNLLPVDNTQTSNDANDDEDQQPAATVGSTSTDPYYARPSAGRQGPTDPYYKSPSGDRQRPAYNTDYTAERQGSTYDTDYKSQNTYGQRQKFPPKPAAVIIPPYNSWHSSRPSPNPNAYSINSASSPTGYPSTAPASPSGAPTTSSPSWYYRNQQR